MAVVVDYGRSLMELGRYAARMGKPAGGLKRVGEYLRGLTLQAFRESKDPTTGAAWAPLAPSTIKQRKGKRAQILVDTSGLRRSIVSKITGRNKIAVGTAKKYGVFHQFGTKNMVPRPFLGFDKRGEKQIEEIMKRWILGKQ